MTIEEALTQVAQPRAHEYVAGDENSLARQIEHRAP